MFGEAGLGLLEFVLLMLAAFDPFHTHKMGRRQSSAGRGPPRPTQLSLTLIHRLLLGSFVVVVVVSLKTRLVMRAGYVVGGCGDEDGVGVVGAVGMLEAVLILDSWS